MEEQKKDVENVAVEEKEEEQFETFEQAMQRQIRQSQKKKMIRLSVFVAIVLLALGGYVYYKKQIEPKKKYASAIASFATVQIGDEIPFGSYEQDKWESDGEEDIMWIVLDKTEDGVLMIMKDCLLPKAYNKEFTETTWEKCTLRAWLNDEFLHEIFSDQELSIVRESDIVTEGNEEYGTDGGNDTKDYLFLLSAKEAKQYFATDEDRKLGITPVAELTSINRSASYGSSWWWLRTPGNLNDAVATVDPRGAVSMFGHDVSSETGALRPAVWINIK